MRCAVGTKLGPASCTHLPRRVLAAMRAREGSSESRTPSRTADSTASCRSAPTEALGSKLYDDSVPVWVARSTDGSIEASALAQPPSGIGPRSKPAIAKGRRPTGRGRGGVPGTEGPQGHVCPLSRAQAAPSRELPVSEVGGIWVLSSVTRRSAPVHSPTETAGTKPPLAASAERGPLVLGPGL